MRGFNRVIIAGNLTRDPDLRYTVNKKAYVKFGVAVNSKWKNANGELQESTEYINVVVWGAMAENCGKYLKKGSPVLLEGRIQTSTYEAKDGSGKRTMTEINADNVQFLSSGQGQNSGGGSYSRPSASPEWPDIHVPSDEDFGRPLSEAGFFAGNSSVPVNENVDVSPRDDLGSGAIPF